MHLTNKSRIPDHFSSPLRLIPAGMPDPFPCFPPSRSARPSITLAAMHQENLPSHKLNRQQVIKTLHTVNKSSCYREETALIKPAWILWYDFKSSGNHVLKSSSEGQCDVAHIFVCVCVCGACVCLSVCVCICVCMRLQSYFCEFLWVCVSVYVCATSSNFRWKSHQTDTQTGCHVWWPRLCDCAAPAVCCHLQTDHSPLRPLRVCMGIVLCFQLSIKPPATKTYLISVKSGVAQLHFADILL